MTFHLHSRNYLRLFNPSVVTLSASDLHSRNYLRLFNPVLPGFLHTDLHSRNYLRLFNRHDPAHRLHIYIVEII